MPARQRVRAVRFALLSAVCGLMCAGAARAQLEVTPYIGSYRPLTFLGSGDASPPAGARDTARHQSSVTLGLRVTQWWPGPLGFEGRIGYAPSSLGTSGGGSSTYAVLNPQVYAAHVWTMSAEALVRLTAPTARARVHVGAGAGLVGHGGPGYQPDSYGGPTTFVGGIAGVGAAIRLSPGFSVRLDAEDFIYSAHLGPCYRTGPGSSGVCDLYGQNAGRTSAPRLQDDLVLSFGFVLPLNRAAQAPD